MRESYPSPIDAPPLLFRPRHRLTHAREFEAVYAAKCRKIRGPLHVHTLPNTLGHPRLGLAVSARVGSAVVRTRLKRLVREAFRLEQHTLGSLDFVVSVRSASPPTLAACRAMLLEIARDAAGEWARRERRSV
jgi:ribonuclease P protein component